MDRSDAFGEPLLSGLPDSLVDVVAAIRSYVLSAPSAADLWDAARSYAWYGLALLLQPFSQRLARRMIAGALRLDQPQFGFTVHPIDTVTVNGGKDVLRGTLWLPTGRGVHGPYPVVIIRTPYGQFRHAEFGQSFFAERGYAVLYQNTRGRFGSDGEFVPVDHERQDGAATVRWVREQMWCNGQVAVYGVSYLGFTAWACVGEAKPGEIQAALPFITQSRVHSAAFGAGGSVSLELIVLWFFLVWKVLLVRAPLEAWRTIRGALPTISDATMHTPLLDLDQVLLGRKVAFYQEGLAEPDADGPFWRHRDVLCELRPGKPGATVPPPIHIVTGWYDFFLAEAIRDFERAAAVQRDARLTVGAHDHWGLLHLPHLRVAYRQALALLDEELGPLPPPGVPQGAAADRDFPPLPAYTERRAAVVAAAGAPAADAERSAELRLPVQLCMLGSQRWKGYAKWPPTNSTRETSLWLTSARRLALSPPALSRKVERTLCFRYDPANPTPALGGPSFNPFNSGARNQRALERRGDVVVFSSPVLRRALVVVGYVRLRLRAASSARSADFVARLCEASPGRGSTNICEGMHRIHARPDQANVGGDSGEEVVVELGPVAAEFGVGSRIRLHVCSSAHPRWMRNLNQPPEVPIAEQALGPPSSQRIWVDDSATQLILPVDND